MQICSEAISDYDKSLDVYRKIPQTTFNLYNVRKGKLVCLQKLTRTEEFQTELETVLKLSEETLKNNTVFKQKKSVHSLIQFLQLELQLHRLLHLLTHTKLDTLELTVHNLGLYKTINP
jgi:hypothetical protein